MPTRLHRTTVALLAGVLALLCAAPAAQADAELLNRVVIRVNDRIATLHDYRQRLREAEQGIAQADLPLAERRELIARLPEQVYRSLLEEQLLLSRADQLGVVFTEEEVEAQLGRMRESYGFASNEEFEAALRQAPGDRTLRDFREEMRKNMRLNELMAREVRSQLGVDEEQARIYYRDHPEDFTTPQRLHLQELVVLEEAQADAVRRQELARSIRAEILAGKAVEEVVEAYSEEGLTSGVIDLGWVVAGDLAAELEQAAWDLEAGEVSEPVESRGGTHVIRVVERQAAGVRPFNEVSDEALGRARQQAFNEAMEAYMEELEERSFVELHPPPEAADFRSASPPQVPVLDEPASEPPPEPEADVTGSPEPPDPSR